MDDINSAESNPATDATPAVQSSGASANGKQHFDITKFISWQLVRDFLNFKIMIIPVIVKYLYILAVFLLICSAFYSCVKLWYGFGLVLFPFAAVLIVFLLHIVFEFFMLGFAILDTQRQIRNELAGQTENNSRK